MLYIMIFLITTLFLFSLKNNDLKINVDAKLRMILFLTDEAFLVRSLRNNNVIQKISNSYNR
jgi:hypothetical protein